MLFRRQPQKEDEATKSLVRRGVYHLADTYDDEEAKQFKNTRVAYSFWSAVKHTLTLSIILWWLPVFGQMIAGYVGGRRAGSPWKGVLAALIPVLVIFVFSGLVKVQIIPTVWFGVDMSPASILGIITSQVPVLQPYLDFASMYLHSFFASLETTANLGLDAYIITIAFAYLGGAMSEQTRREMEYIAGRSRGGNATVVIEGNTFTQGASKHSLLHHQDQSPASFGAMTDLGGDADEMDEEPEPLRAANRKLLEEEVPPQKKKMVRDRAKTMVKEQREVERKSHKRNDAPQGLLKRASQDQGGEGAQRGGEKKAEADWEYI